MNKLILLLAFLAFMAYSQPPPGPFGSDDSQGAPPPPEGTTQEAAMMTVKSSKPPSEDWYCDIEFYINGKPYFYESLSYGEAEAYRGSFSKKYDNRIDEVYWSGTRCYCWIVLYQGKYFKGLNLGLWTDSESESGGSYDLSKYITYDFKDRAWEAWDSTVSSYSIYCY